MTVTDELFDVEREFRDSKAHELAYVVTRDYRFVHKELLQRVLFICDAVAMDTVASPLTDIGWKPFMYGMHSSWLDEGIDEVAKDSKNDMLRGKRVTAYFELEKPADVGPDVESVWNSVKQRVEDKSLDELSELVKDDPRYQRTDYDTELQW